MRGLVDVMNDMMSGSDLLAAAIVKRLSPEVDEINKTEAYERYGRGWIDKMTDKELLHPRRKGSFKNSPVMYSKHEIVALIESERHMVEELKRYVANN